MRSVIAAICCLMPLLAQAQNQMIPEPVSRQVDTSCFAACTQTRPAEFCSPVCACAVDELQRGWTVGEVRDKAAALSRGREAGPVRDEIGRIAAQCAERIR